MGSWSPKLLWRTQSILNFISCTEAMRVIRCCRPTYLERFFGLAKHYQLDFEYYLCSPERVLGDPPERTAKRVGSERQDARHKNWAKQLDSTKWDSNYGKRRQCRGQSKPWPAPTTNALSNLTSIEAARKHFNLHVNANWMSVEEKRKAGWIWPNYAIRSLWSECSNTAQFIDPHE